MKEIRIRTNNYGSESWMPKNWRILRLQIRNRNTAKNDPVPFWPLVRDGNEQPGSRFRKLKSIFWVTLFKFFDADPGWKKFESGINIPDLQHWFAERTWWTNWPDEVSGLAAPASDEEALYLLPLLGGAGLPRHRGDLSQLLKHPADRQERWLRMEKYSSGTGDPWQFGADPDPLLRTSD